MSPRYTIRESPKAKHVSLKVSAAGGLEVVVPPGFDQSRIPAIVQQKQRWIDRVTQKVQPQGIPEASVPTQLTLTAIAQSWQVDYRHESGQAAQLHEYPGFNLVLSAMDDRAAYAVLQRWIMQQANLHLLPWLRAVSGEIGLPYQQATVRQQRTIWGSCSAQKTISLNCKLLFLPSALVRYVFIHELCHTVHLNHSAQFWASVDRHESDYRPLDAALRSARDQVPPWME